MQASYTERQMDQRAEQIMKAARAGSLQPGSDAMAELVEITEAQRDRPVKPVVIARLTMIKQDGVRLIVEIEAGCTFNAFYKFYKQTGGRRSTKTLVRKGSRNEGLDQIGYYHPGLETVAARVAKYMDPSNPIVSSKIRIIRRADYARLIAARPDQLGLTKMDRLPIFHPCPTRRTS